ncbi:hypothetical protein BJ741DRAFT_608983 [Chytriomyces cf. hyalinus JEL632]|nr:hypothetical protein BJ741DRAFT_608983 [Chytriomyces cf. hyalinus JEL632]
MASTTDLAWQQENQQAPPNPPNPVPPPEVTLPPPSSSTVPNSRSTTIVASAILSSTTTATSARIQISSSVDSLAFSASNASSSNNNSTSNFIPLLFAYVASALVLGFLLGLYCFYAKKRQRFKEANLTWSPPASGRVSVSKAAAALELPQKRNDDLDILSSAKTRLSYIRHYPQLYELAVDPRLRESRIDNAAQLSSAVKQQAIINSAQADIHSGVCVEQKVVLIETPLSVQLSSEAASGLVGTVEHVPVVAGGLTLPNHTSPDHLLERVGSQRSYDFVR